VVATRECIDVISAFALLISSIRLSSCARSSIPAARPRYLDHAFPSKLDHFLAVVSMWGADLNGASPLRIAHTDGSVAYVAVDPWAGTLYLGLSVPDRLDRMNLDGTGSESLYFLPLYNHISGLVLAGCHLGG